MVSWPFKQCEHDSPYKEYMQPNPQGSSLWNERTVLSPNIYTVYLVHSGPQAACDNGTSAERLTLTKVGTRYNEPLHNEVLGVTNDFSYPSNSKI